MRKVPASNPLVMVVQAANYDYATICTDYYGSCASPSTDPSDGQTVSQPSNVACCEAKYRAQTADCTIPYSTIRRSTVKWCLCVPSEYSQKNITARYHALLLQQTFSER